MQPDNAARSAYDVDDDEAALLLNSGDEFEELPGCPICLNDILDLREKCVLSPCMHVFCISCLTTWVRLKRVCPLCKGGIASYMYDIQSEAVYRERMIPASPELVQRETISAGGQPIVPPTWPHHSGSRSSAPEGSMSHSSWRSAVSSAAASDAQRAVGRALRQSRQQGARGGASVSAAQQQAEPRPYFWRVQQRLTAGLLHSAGAMHCLASPPSSSHQQLQWRRSVYSQGLWALPIAAQAASHAVSSSRRVRATAAETINTSWDSLRSGRDKIIETWVDRELRALLEVQDTTLVRSFVIALLRSFGFQLGASSSQSMSARGSHFQGTPLESASATGGGSSVQQGTEGPVPVLSRFLFEHASHFWHEVSCFGLSGLSMGAWDRSVQYEDRQSHAQGLPPGQTHALDVQALTSAAASVAARISAAGREAGPQQGIRSHAANHSDFAEEVLDLEDPMEHRRHPRLPVNQNEQERSLHDCVLVEQSGAEVEPALHMQQHSLQLQQQGTEPQQEHQLEQQHAASLLSPSHNAPRLGGHGHTGPSSNQVHSQSRGRDPRPALRGTHHESTREHHQRNRGSKRRERSGRDRSISRERDSSRMSPECEQRGRRSMQLSRSWSHDQHERERYRLRSLPATHERGSSRQTQEMHRCRSSELLKGRSSERRREVHRGPNQRWEHPDTVEGGRWKLEWDKEHVPEGLQDTGSRSGYQDLATSHETGQNRTSDRAHAHRREQLHSRNLDRLTSFQQDSRSRAIARSRAHERPYTAVREGDSFRHYSTEQIRVIDANDRWVPEDPFNSL